MVIPSAPIRVASVRYTGTGLSVPVCRNPLKGQNSLSLSLSLTCTHMHACAHTHTHTHTHARARTHTHAHTHTLCNTSPLPPLPSDVSFSLLLPTRHLVFLPSLSLCLSLLPICPWQRNKEPSKPGVEVKLLTVAIDIKREREIKSLQHCVLRYTGAKYRFWDEIPVKIPVRLSVPVPRTNHEDFIGKSHSYSSRLPWRKETLCFLGAT